MLKSNGKQSKIRRKIYLDYASSALSTSANPGAIHELGVKEKSKLENARVRVAQILNARAFEIVFTSGATESNNLAILGMPRGHIVTTNIEHASVLETCKHRGEVTYVEVEANGIVNSEKVKKALRPDTILVSVMYANNEIGTIQPIREIAKEIRHFNKLHSRNTGSGAKQIFFHTDATQATNYLPLNVIELGVDMLSLNSAKIYGPKGVGALYVKKGTPISPIMFGGEQEGGLRPGTENVAGILEFTQALETIEKIKSKEVKRLTLLRDYFINKLHFMGVIINGDLQNRLPNNINITIPKIPSDLLVIELSARGVMASAKSACKSGDGKDSHVVRALRTADGLPAEAKASAGSLRFSLGRETTKRDIDYTLRALRYILEKLQKWY
ncbi:MAG TPA: cysteine desulfurase family protein [Candidatus Paceibacterota bacterium]